MSYIGLFNETDISTDTATVDTIVINTNLSSLGTNTLNNTTLTGSLTGFTTVGEGETIFSYTPSTRTFNISTPVNSIDPTKLIAGTAGQIIQTNDLNDAVWVDMSGDAIINANGVMTVDKSRTVLMASTTVNGNYNLLFRTGTTNGYNTLYNQVNITYNPSTQTFTTTNGVFNGILSALGTATFPNGSSAQGAPYSAIFGKASSTQSGQIAIIDGTSNNQYAQLYCRSNVFGIQGNITSISLQKNTNITGTLDVTSGVNIGVSKSYKINNIPLNTDNIQENTVPVNLYYTPARFDTQLATKTTDNLTAGTNKYLNSLSTNNTTEITHIYSIDTPLSSSINNNSINLSKINASAYTTTATPSTLVLRDVHGSFSGFNIISTGAVTTNDLYIYGTTDIRNEFNFYEGHTINLIPSAGLDCPLICWYEDQGMHSIDISPLNSSINFHSVFGFNTISLNGSSGQIVCRDTNIATGQSYKINNIPLNTDNIQEKTVSPANLYFTPARFDTQMATKTTDNLLQGANKYYNTTLFNADLATKTTDNLLQGTTNKYLNALTVSSPNEITLTYSANNLSASLIDNKIDISKIKTSQISSSLVSNTLVKRDNVGNINTSGLTSYDAVSVFYGTSNSPPGASVPSMILGDSVNFEGVLRMRHGNDYSTILRCNNTNGFFIDPTDNGSLNLCMQYIINPAPVNIGSPITAYMGINLPSSQTYKINNLPLSTDNLVVGGNKYLNSLTVASPNEITLTYSTPNLSASLLNNTIDLTKLKTSQYNSSNVVSNLVQRDASGNFSAGTIKSDILSTDSIKGSTTTSVIDLWTSTNQTNINSRTQIKYGLSNLTTPTASSPSLVLGSLDIGNLDDGVIHIYGSAGAKHCIQASANNNLYLDNPSGGNFVLNSRNNVMTKFINYGVTNLIDTVINGTLQLTDTLSTININMVGSSGAITAKTITTSELATLPTINSTNATITNLNMLNVPLYNGLKFSNINKASMTLGHTAVIPITNWAVVGNTATSTVLQTSIVARSNNAIRITVNIPLSNWGTSATNHHMSLSRTATGIPFTFGQTLAVSFIGGSYGIHHIMSGIQYDSASFSYIDNLAITVGYTYTYCIVVRQNTIASAGNIGNSNYSEITVEEIY